MQASIICHGDPILPFSDAVRKLGFPKMEHSRNNFEDGVALLFGEAEADHALQDTGELCGIIHARNRQANLAILKVVGCMEL